MIIGVGGSHTVLVR